MLTFLPGSPVSSSEPSEPAGSDQDRPIVVDSRWLVELDRPPSLLAANEVPVSDWAEWDRSFRAGLERLAENADGPPPRIFRSYRKLWSGYAVEATPEQAARLESLPGVLRVIPERPIWALLDESVPLIGADVLHNRLPSRTGAGIEIAVIDTGIDYMHPDLGEGLGPGFKVIGGFDFIDDDADPLDEHGHGTHVAATIAGDGVLGGNPLPGVAPGASLIGIRVLNASGVGTQADLLAGLEWAADPDGDPGTPDAPDIVVTALGGFGYPDDPVSQAVDLLSSVGALVVAGSGNFGGPGTRYQSILSPATARSALAVGLTDGTDSVEDRSSRGFAGVFLPKPDLVAPGTEICAARHATWLPGFTCGDSQHVETTGTSLSAAHVAGAAALVLQENPSLDGELAGAILKETTLDVGEDLLVQGSGRLRAVEAVDATAVVLPSTLVTERVDLCQPSWTTDIGFQVQNLGAFPATFDVEFLATGLDPGVAAQLDANQANIPAGSSAPFNLRVDVDNSVASPVADPPFGHTGTVRVTSADRPGLELRVPVWIPASPSLPLSIDFEPLELVLHDRAGRSWRYVAPGSEMEAALPAGTYDVLVVGPGFQQLVLREGVSVESCNTPTLDVSSAEAVHRVQLGWTTRAGQALPTRPVRCDLALRHDSGFLYAVNEFSVRFLRLSEISTSYRLEFACVDRDARGDLHVATIGNVGLTADVPIDPNPLDWHQILLEERRPAGPAWLGASPARVAPDIAPSWFSSTELNGPGPDEPGVTRSFWVTTLPWDDFAAFSGALFTAGPNPFPEASVPAELRSLGVTARSGSIDVFYPGEGLTDTVASIAAWDTRLPLGLGPFSFSAESSHLPTLLQLFPARGPIWEMAMFRGQLGTHRPSTSFSPAGHPYDVRQGAVTISGLFDHFGPAFFAPQIVNLPASGPTELEVTFDGYTISGLGGTATAILSMDTDLPDPNPPALTRLQLLHRGTPTDQLVDCPDPVILRLDFTEPAGSLGSVTAESSPSGAASWAPFPLGPSGDGLEGTLPLSGTGGAVDLRILAVDSSGNQLEMLAEPAWLEIAGPGGVDPGNSLRVRRTSSDVVLEWSGDPQAVHRFRTDTTVPLTPASREEIVTGTTWTDSGAVGGATGVTFYKVTPYCS